MRQVAEGSEPGTLVANVQGSQLYHVTLRFDDEDLVARCECPYFLDHEEPCKHIWAAMRAASARGLLPDREYLLTVEAASRIRPAASRDQRPQWQRFLEALGPEREKQASSRNVPDELAYVIVQPRSESLTLQLRGRSQKKNGEWSKWKVVHLHTADLAHLSPFDRENVALLNQRPYAATIDPVIYVAAGAAAWWVERLARAGGLYVAGNDELLPISWDDGPPWTFRVAIVNDATSASYRISGTIDRNGESLPLKTLDILLPGILVARNRAARFEDAGQSAWLYALRANGQVEIPHADADKFRQALLRAPLANIDLPAELGWSVVETKPQPILSLQHDAWSAELHGELSFQYDEWRVSSRSAEMKTTIGRKLLRRDRAAEDVARARLSALGAIAAWDGFRIRAAQLEELARKLTSEGWQLEIDSAPVRVTDDIDVEISSGIDWFDLNVNASFGDIRLSLPELLSAAEAKRSILRLADGSYGIVPMAWTEALAPVLEMGKREGAAVRFRQVQALLIDALLQSKTRTADEGFTALRERLSGSSPEPRPEPPTLQAELRPYQRAGLGWMHFLRDTGLGGCLADDMGLGKTVQTLALLEELRAGGSTRPSLVVAPRSLLFNWAAEAKKFAPQLRVVQHHGTDREQNVFDDCDVVLTTYATMRLDVGRLAETEFEYVILDEAQAIKNATSQVAKAVRLLKSKHRLALSGTPIENHLGELWSLFEFLNPGLLGPVRMFNRTFAAKNVTPDRREALARALRPLILRRTKEQVAPELPERIEQTLFCELEGKQLELYNELRDHYRAALLKKVRTTGVDKSRMQILEALLRLRQAACDPALIDEHTEASSAKIELLMEELRDVLDSGHRALVFSQFTSFLDIVRGALEHEKIEHLYLDGATRDRQSLVEQFQSADGPPLFLISLKAGGLGLNLTNADYIFLLDPWWNPAVEAQAIDRAHRIGRQKPVVAYRLIARDTVEEKILELQAKKRELAESIISEDNSVLRKIELEDLELLLG
ncbi:MAG TPA: SNF2-related protein [Thermoanaerobaculia bacterium]|nr:SNF2-related protein [Thermoanaerobaculia bacterium]